MSSVGKHFSNCMQLWWRVKACRCAESWKSVCCKVHVTQTALCLSCYGRKHYRGLCLSALPCFALCHKSQVHQIKCLFKSNGASGMLSAWLLVKEIHCSICELVSQAKMLPCGLCHVQESVAVLSVCNNDLQTFRICEHGSARDWY